jgi:hypothetical protein
MIRQSVISSELKSVGYDEGNAILEVEFQNGGIYRYFGVPKAAYAALISAPSKGRYFNAQIGNAYRYERIA